MAREEQLYPLLKWHPEPPGDPGPEVYLLFRDLDRKRQVQIVSAILEARVRITEATGQAYKAINAAVQGAGG